MNSILSEVYSIFITCEFVVNFPEKDTKDQLFSACLVKGENTVDIFLYILQLKAFVYGFAFSLNSHFVCLCYIVLSIIYIYFFFFFVHKRQNNADDFHDTAAFFF